MYFQNTFMLDLWDSDCEYAIFDDVPWDYLTNKKGFFGAQRWLVLTDKYKKKRSVKWGKPCIYLINPEDKPNQGFGHWYRENCFIVDVGDKLY